MNMQTDIQLSSNSEYREMMLSMLLDVMAKQNIILAQLTDMNKLDPDFIDEQIVEEKKLILEEFRQVYQPD
jgi:predicted Zn-dependent peptidase